MQGDGALIVLLAAARYSSSVNVSRIHIVKLCEMTVRMRRHAPFNVMLIYMQRPDATHVLSAADWRALRRFPKAEALPIVILRPLPVPVAPLNEQRRIVDALDELFSDLDAGVAALERVQAKLKHYRAAVLKAAVEGALTAEWRAQHPATEPASALLTRILAERRRRWEETQLQKFKEAGKEPPKNWKAKYKEPVAPDMTSLPLLPNGWCWVSH